MIFGMMDGSVRILRNVHLPGPEELFHDTELHTKYVIRAKWGKGCFATASYDRTVHLYRLVAGSTEEDGTYEHTQKWSFSGNVESLEFTPDNLALVVAARGDNYLSYIQLRDLSVSALWFSSSLGLTPSL